MMKKYYYFYVVIFVLYLLLSILSRIWEISYIYLQIILILLWASLSAIAVKQMFMLSKPERKFRTYLFTCFSFIVLLLEILDVIRNLRD